VKKLFALLLLALALPALAAGVPRKVTEVEGVSEYRLDNGLRVLLVPDASADTVTVHITYLVGSRHESYGEKGMAHLLEHMLFKGSKKHPDVKQEFAKRGARWNGTRSGRRRRRWLARCAARSPTPAPAASPPASAPTARPAPPPVPGGRSACP
jgi:hypothetical protein